MRRNHRGRVPSRQLSENVDNFLGKFWVERRGQFVAEQYLM